MVDNRWTDMFKLNPNSQVFAPSVFQARVVPFGPARFALIDPPGIMVDATRERDLVFDTRLRANGEMRQIKAHQRIGLNQGNAERIEFTVLANDYRGIDGLNPQW